MEFLTELFLFLKTRKKILAIAAGANAAVIDRACDPYQCAWRWRHLFTLYSE